MPSSLQEDNVEKYALSEDDTPFIVEQLDCAIRQIHALIIRFTYRVSDALKGDELNYVGFRVVHNAGYFDHENKIDLLDSYIEEYLVVSILSQWAFQSGLESVSKETKQSVELLTDKILKLVALFSKRIVSKSYLLNEV